MTKQEFINAIKLVKTKKEYLATLGKPNTKENRIKYVKNVRDSFGITKEELEDLFKDE